MVLNYAYRQGILKSLPQFKDEYDTKKNTASRSWFISAEYAQLHRAIDSHAKHFATRDKLQHKTCA